MAPLVAVVIAMFAASCGESMDMVSGSDTPNCRNNGCPVGDVCTAEGVCVPESTQAMTVSLRLVPPEGSDLFEEHLTDLAVDGTANLGAVRFHQPVTTDGRVFFSSDDTTDFAGRVTFTRVDTISGIPITTDSVVSEDGRYEVELVPGTYQVTVRADDVPIPPFRIDDFVVESGDTQLDIQLPNPEDHFDVVGRCVRHRPGSDEDIEIRGARVVLQSSAGAAVSTASDTDGEGVFRVTALPNEPEYFVRIGPGTMNSSIPELLLGPIDITASTDLGVLVVGEWDDLVEVDGAVSGQNGIPRPIAGATVFFRQQLALGTYSQLARADESGAFSASLIPGDYHVVVAPPVEEPYGAEAFDETLDPESAPPDAIQNAVVHGKPVLYGTITGLLGQPLANTVLTAEPTSFNVSLLALGPVSTSTDVQGWFELLVHPSAQRLVVQPPSGLGLAPYLVNLSVVASDQQLDIQLDRAGQLSGTLLAPNGAPLQDATVEAFVGFDDETISFAVADTDPNGSFVIDLPQFGP